MFQPQDLDDFVRALEAVTASGAEYERIVKAARDWIADTCSVERVVGMYEEVYRRVLAGTK